jgi:hypothetical protein
LWLWLPHLRLPRPLCGIAICAVYRSAWLTPGRSDRYRQIGRTGLI